MDARAGRARIAVLGLTGVGNLGNDASKQTMIDALRRMAPGIEVECVSGRPAEAAQIFALPCAPMKWPTSKRLAFRIADRLGLRVPSILNDVRQTRRYLKGFDAVVVAGTGILDDFGVSPFELPLSIWIWSVSARSMRKKLAFVSVGAGPISHPLSRRLMMGALKHAGYRSFRDAESMHFARAHGIAASDRDVFPDLVFGGSLTPNEPLRKSDPSGKLIGVGVMNYYGWRYEGARSDATHQRYLDEVCKLVSLLDQRGRRPVLLIGAEDSAMHGELQARLERLGAFASGLPKIRVGQTLSHHAEHMGDLDIVVATRYHTLVAALCQGKPAISIGYAEKFRALQQSFGLARYTHSTETFRAEAVADHVETLLGSKEHAAAAIQAILRQSKDRLMHQEELLSRYLFADHRAAGGAR